MLPAKSRATVGVCASLYFPQQQPDLAMHRCSPRSIEYTPSLLIPDKSVHALSRPCSDMSCLRLLCSLLSIRFHIRQTGRILDEMLLQMRSVKCDFLNVDVDHCGEDATAFLVRWMGTASIRSASASLYESFSGPHLVREEQVPQCWDGERQHPKETAPAIADRYAGVNGPMGDGRHSAAQA